MGPEKAPPQKNISQTNVSQYFCYLYSTTIYKKKYSFTITNCKTL